MIDPGIWQSQDFGKLSTLAKLVFIGLFSQADDDGRGRANPQYIKNTLFPYDEEMLKGDIERSLDEIAENMSILFYDCGGNEYYNLTNWSVWQKVDRPQKSRLPAPEDDDSTIVRRTLNDSSSNVREQLDPNRIEQNRTEQKITHGASAPEGVGESGGDSVQVKRGNKQYETHFEVFWSAYPRKDDKGQAYKKYQARLNDGFSEEELLQAAKAYAEQCKRDKTAPRYIKQGKTFLGDATPFRDFLPKQDTKKQECEDPFEAAYRELENSRIDRDGD